MDNPAVRQFFDGPRGRAAHEQADRQPKVPTDDKTKEPSSKPR
jgi:phospholipid/cholesterol/gamma-HCH transport system ATP-binding protein